MVATPMAPLHTGQPQLLAAGTESQSCESRSIADLVCSNVAPPSIAVCLAGTSRSFEKPLVYRTIKENLIRSIGGRVTLFAVMNTVDEVGYGRHPGNVNVTEDGDIQQVERALAHVADGPLGPRMRITREAQGAAPPTCYGTPSNPQKLAKLAALAGQLSRRAACGELIHAEEARRGGGARFDWVILSRPDLTWYASMVPHCFWAASHTQRKWDWVHVGRRDAAQRWLVELPRHFFACELRSTRAPRVGEPFQRLSDRFGSVRFGARDADWGVLFNATRDDFQAEEILLGVADAGPYASENNYNIPAAVTRMRVADRSICPRMCNQTSPMRLQAPMIEQRCLEVTDGNLCGGEFGLESV